MAKTPKDWYHFSSHGTLLVYIAANPNCTIKQMADALCLTERSVWGTVGALVYQGQVQVYRNHRRNHYCVNPEAPFLHPTVKGVKIGDLFHGMTPDSRADMSHN